MQQDDSSGSPQKITHHLKSGDSSESTFSDFKFIYMLTKRFKRPTFVYLLSVLYMTFDQLLLFKHAYCNYFLLHNLNYTYTERHLCI